MENGISFCKRNNFDYEIFSETISGGKGFDDREMFNDLSGKLLNKELGDNLTVENVRAFLQNEEKLSDLKNKALGSVFKTKEEQN